MAPCPTPVTGLLLPVILPLPSSSFLQQLQPPTISVSACARSRVEGMGIQFSKSSTLFSGFALTLSMNL